MARSAVLIGRVIPMRLKLITGVLGSFRGTIQLLPRFLQIYQELSAYEGCRIWIFPTSGDIRLMTWNRNSLVLTTITNLEPKLT